MRLFFVAVTFLLLIVGGLFWLAKDRAGGALPDDTSQESGRAGTELSPVVEGEATRAPALSPGEAGPTSEPKPKEPAATCVIRGKVLSSRRDGIPGADVRIELRGPFGPVELARIVADASGEYAFELDSIDRRAEVWVLASAHGFQTKAQEAHPNPRDVRAWEAWIRLQPGITVSGRVFDGLGAPLSGARVELVQNSRSVITVTGAGGRYAIGIEPGVLLSANARHGDAGWGRVELNELEARVDTVLPDIVASERGVLEGRLIFPDGVPARGFAVHASEPGTRDRSIARLDASGAFRFVDLLPDRAYRLVAHTDRELDFHDYPNRVGDSVSPIPIGARGDSPETLYSTTSGPLEIELDVRRLIVHVTTSGGKPATGHAVLVLPSAFLGRALGDATFFPRQRPHGGPADPFLVPPGTEVAVLAWDVARFPGAEVPRSAFAVIERMMLPDLPVETTVHLVLP